ncbi:MAG: hypothetical protein LBP50_02900 [Tannerella sp.]|jgi:hypothetical protein|nr:hypothetical protein [Tannerella sp.]
MKHKNKNIPVSASPEREEAGVNRQAKQRKGVQNKKRDCDRLKGIRQH